MSVELAKRAVACKRWRWMPGMRAVDGAERFRVSVVSHGYPEGVDEQPPMKVNVDLGLRWLPDLTDPATGGCLLALVSEVWAENGRMWLSYGDPGWFIHVEIGGAMWPDEMYRKFPCYTEALIAALEAAP